MFIRAFQVDGRTVIVAYLGEGRVALADFSQQRIIALLSIKDMSFSAFDLSQDGTKLVTGHDCHSRFRVWSLNNCEKLVDYGRPTAARVKFDLTGEFVFTWASGSGKAVYSLMTGKPVSLRNLGDLDGAYLDTKSNTFCAPIENQPRIYAITFCPLEISYLKLPSTSGVYSLRGSPINDNIILFYENGHVECRNGIRGDLVWSRYHEERDIVSGGHYSANGRFVAVAMINRKQLWVLDSANGEIIHAIDQSGRGFCPGSPLQDNLILGDEGQILDAEKGRICNGPSAAEWWKKAGL